MVDENVKEVEVLAAWLEVQRSIGRIKRVYEDMPSTHPAYGKYRDMIKGLRHQLDVMQRESVNPWLASVLKALGSQASEDGVTVHRFDSCTVFQGKSEVIVYGDGSDWVVQYANVTNSKPGWRRWFSDRSTAESVAREAAGKKYGGLHGC
jgi:hypothetical protein